MTKQTTYLVAGFAVVFGLIWMFVQMTMPEGDSKSFHFEKFGDIPCQANGRVKPLDTVARTYLMIISGRQTFYDEEGKEHPAIEWLMDVMVSRQVINDADRPKSIPRAYTLRVFRVDSEQLINMLGLEPRSGFRYSYMELLSKDAEFRQVALRAAKKNPNDLDEADIKLRDLGNHFRIFDALAALKVPNQDEDEPRLDLGFLPPAAGSDTWGALRRDDEQGFGGQLNNLLAYYQRGNAEEFNKALDQYTNDIDQAQAKDVSKARFESFFNHFAPFYWCSLVYLLVLVMCFVSWMAWTKPLQVAAFSLTALALIVHTFAIVARMYIQDRPPVTNLYSSAVFIGWGAVALCLALEYLNWNGISNVGAAALGAATLFIAHFLGSEGDTMEMLQAVLDTNFWLATHVVCVTLGYTATFVAGFLGVAFVGVGVFTPFLKKDWIKVLGQATYGVLCFATLLSFTGTVLGGIWADQSWGRFWGWDPKENGAVLIVIWNALILHARWSGLVKERGIAVMTIFGNMVTAWSWFGTNQLGVGLHAYGFNKHLATGCALFWVSQLFLIVVGCLPYKYWWSFNAATYAPQPIKRPTLNKSVTAGAS